MVCDSSCAFCAQPTSSPTTNSNSGSRRQKTACFASLRCLATLVPRKRSCAPPTWSIGLPPITATGRAVSTLSPCALGSIVYSPPRVLSGLNAKELTEKFDRTYWSPAPAKFVAEAVMVHNCPDCKKEPVLRKPKNIRWQHILAHGCVACSAVADRFG